MNNPMSQESGEPDQIRRHVKEDLEGLASFICGPEYAQTAKGLRLDQEVPKRAAKLFPSFQAPFLRRETLELLVNLLRDDINDMLSKYQLRAHPIVRFELQPHNLAELELEAHRGHLNMLHRLVLVMIYREGYTAHACARMLGCNDDAIHSIRLEALSCLEAEREAGMDNEDQ